MSRRLRASTDWMRNNWEVIGLALALGSTAALYILSTLLSVFSLPNGWYLPLIYVALISIVFILLEIRSHTSVSSGQSALYPSLQEAQPDIVKKLEVAARDRSRGDVELIIWANRLSRVAVVVGDAIRLSDRGALGNKKLSISVYHTDPAMLPDDYLPGPRDAQVDDKHRTYLSSLASNIDWVARSAQAARNVEVEFVKCAQIPYFYAYVINDKYMFWGYFRWDEELKDWVGPSSPCNYVERGKDAMGLLDWIRNRFMILDGLYR